VADQVAPPAEQTPPVTPPAEVDRFAALEAKLTSLTDQVAETTRTAQFWYEKANATAKPADKPADEEDVLDVITKGGDALDKLLEKRGFVKADQVDSKLNQRTQQLTKEAALVKQYPDLENTESPFFKEVAAVYGTLVKSGVAQSVAMEMAANQVELAWYREGKRETVKERKAREDADKESQRQERIRAQAGDRGRRPAAEPEDGDDELTAEQKQIAVRMLAGDGVTPEQAIEAYKKRAKSGVAVRGGMR